jgi:hypothetical protein
MPSPAVPDQRPSPAAFAESSGNLTGESGMPKSAKKEFLLNLVLFIDEIDISAGDSAKFQKSGLK